MTPNERIIALNNVLTQAYQESLNLKEEAVAYQNAKAYKQLRLISDLVKRSQEILNEINTL
ncbi:hypothetical protein [Nitrospira sp. BLG_2]|uniref:hypothetical protein n=1 Tax=Nitrospira sp. BLG_2 TaxID=3397507 RepID=UPI003B992852